MFKAIRPPTSTFRCMTVHCSFHYNNTIAISLLESCSNDLGSIWFVEKYNEDLITQFILNVSVGIDTFIVCAAFHTRDFLTRKFFDELQRIFHGEINSNGGPELKPELKP